MKLSELSLKKFPSVIIVYIAFNSMVSSAFSGGPTPGDGGVQIVFSDDGSGGTRVTASGTGQTDDDTNNIENALGFLGANDRDTIENVVPQLALLPDISRSELTNTISFNWSGVGTFTYDGFGTDLIGQAGAYFGTPDGFVDIPPGGATMTVVDGNGIIPLGYSTFAEVHGMSFPTTDGFTFVFAEASAMDGVAVAAACADKAALLREIKKLKKKLKNAKRAGNVSAAKKLKKKLKKLKKNLC